MALLQQIETGSQFRLQIDVKALHSDLVLCQIRLDPHNLPDEDYLVMSENRLIIRQHGYMPLIAPPESKNLDMNTRARKSHTSHISTVPVRLPIDPALGS